MRQGNNTVTIVRSGAGGPVGPSRVGEFQGGTPAGRTRRTSILGGSGTQGWGASSCSGLPGSRVLTPHLAQDQRAEGGVNVGPPLTLPCSCSRRSLQSDLESGSPERWTRGSTWRQLSGCGGHAWASDNPGAQFTMFSCPLGQGRLGGQWYSQPVSDPLPLGHTIWEGVGSRGRAGYLICEAWCKM